MISAPRFPFVFAVFCAVVTRSEGFSPFLGGSGQNAGQYTGRHAGQHTGRNSGPQAGHNVPEKRSTGGDLEAIVLAETNPRRAKHGAKPLTLDSKLSAESKAWAEKLAESDKLEHSSGDYSENLFMSSGLLGPAEAAKQAVNSWYDEEVKKYDFNKPEVHNGAGHFTQLVWKASTKMGVGMATNPAKRTTFVVARYVPAGNYLGQFKDNVGRGP